MHGVTRRRPPSCSGRPAAGPPRPGSRRGAPRRSTRRPARRARPDQAAGRCPHRVSRIRGLRAGASGGRDARENGRAARALHGRRLRAARGRGCGSHPPVARSSRPVRRAPGGCDRVVRARVARARVRALAQARERNRGRAGADGSGTLVRGARRPGGGTPVPHGREGERGDRTPAVVRGAAAPRAGLGRRRARRGRVSSTRPPVALCRAAGRRGLPGAWRLGRGAALLRARPLGTRTRSPPGWRGGWGCSGIWADVSRRRSPRTGVGTRTASPATSRCSSHARLGALASRRARCHVGRTRSARTTSRPPRAIHRRSPPRTPYSRCSLPSRVTAERTTRTTSGRWSMRRKRETCSS